MKQNDTITPRQMLALGFVAVLSPLIRRYPRALAETAGSGAWLAVLLAAVPLAVILAAARLLYRRQPGGTGYGDILTAVLGSLLGRVVTGLYGLWFTAYAGFLLRSGAERFISTVYPGAEPWIFVLVTVLLCMTAALGRLCPIARAAMLFRPLMLLLFLLVFLLTLQDVQPSLLLPAAGNGLPSLGIGALETANVLSSGTVLAFFTDRLSRPFTRRDGAPGWVAGLLGVVLLMTVNCIGMFGAGLTARMSYPFFMLVRDVSVLGSLERAEPVVIALWVLSDFVMLSLLLQAAGKTLRFCFGCEEAPPDRASYLRHGRWLTVLCAVAAAAVALLLPGDLSGFRLLSERIVPLTSAVFSLLLPAAVLLLGLLRGCV